MPFYLYSFQKHSFLWQDNFEIIYKRRVRSSNPALLPNVQAACLRARNHDFRIEIGLRDTEKPATTNRMHLISLKRSQLIQRPFTYLSVYSEKYPIGQSQKPSHHPTHQLYAPSTSVTICTYLQYSTNSQTKRKEEKDEKKTAGNSNNHQQKQAERPRGRECLKPPLT